MAGEKGATTNRALNSLQYAVANVAADIGTGLDNADVVIVYDVSADYEAKKVSLPLAAASGRIVTTTATIVALTATQHGERVVIINTNSTVANTFTLPAATGSGVKYELINGIAQTQGSIVVAALGADVFKGRALNMDSTAVATHASFFVTTATSDKMTWNRTTTGGIYNDSIVLYDEAAAVWRVQVTSNTSGANATPFSET
jgi:hypothetical protein